MDLMQRWSQQWSFTDINLYMGPPKMFPLPNNPSLTQDTTENLTL